MTEPNAGILRIIVLIAAILGATTLCFPQHNSDVQNYFKQYVGLTDDEIVRISSGQAVAKTLHSRTPDEIFIFGAIYVDARPEDYLLLTRDFDRMRKFSGYLDIDRLSVPPTLSEFKGFTFEQEDIKDLRLCKLHNCEVQMPASSIEDLHRLVDWSATNTDEQVNHLLQKNAVERIAAYQRQGNAVLAPYDDKGATTDVAERFKYLLSYSRVLPHYLPEFYSYLMTYPSGRPANVEDAFYWVKVRFGLKPTLRIIHVMTMHGGGAGDLTVDAVAEKQLYSSHYFQTALDLTFCFREKSQAKQTGFVLVKLMGSEQAGLTGLKGSIVRKVAVDRSTASLQKFLTTIKKTLEQR